MKKNVLIVGAGPTGLVAAAWLARLGVPFDIIDRNPEPAQESRALAVQARTLEFYAQLGFAETAVAHGRPLGALNLWTRGSRTAHVEFADMGRGLSPFPYALATTDFLARGRPSLPVPDHLADSRSLSGQRAEQGKAGEVRGGDRLPPRRKRRASHVTPSI